MPGIERCTEISENLNHAILKYSEATGTATSNKQVCKYEPHFTRYRTPTLFLELTLLS